jgi:hypothetical protein
MRGIETQVFVQTPCAFRVAVTKIPKVAKEYMKRLVNISRFLYVALKVK